MDDLISILIVDDNAEFCSVLNKYLNQCEGMVVKGVARDGIEAIHMIKELEPEVVILDLIMPNLDGIGVLEKILEIQLKSRPVFIVLTAVGQDIIVQKTIELGADYYILKPFDVNILVSRIRQIYREKVAAQGKNMYISGSNIGFMPEVRKNSLEVIVTGLIQNIGVAPNIVGYRYLREAVLIMVRNQPVSDPATRDIYSDIAIRHNITVRHVDRAIRCAIKSACQKTRKMKTGLWEMETGSGDKSTLPTNIQVITLLADKARSLSGD